MRKGVFLAIGAYLMWGLFPLYWPLLEPAGAIEILAHRMLWSAVVMGLGITILRRWREIRELSAKTWGLVTAAAIVISINWGMYIYAVNNAHVIEAALGYFINPLVAVGLGVILLREKLAALQWAAIAVAVPGVVLTALGTSGFPYLSFVLATSFGLYGLIKRIIDIPAAISLLGESSVLMLPALGFLIWLQVDGDAHFVGYGSWHIVWMVAAGLVTAVPLLLFSASARLIPLSILGFLQYLNPLTQFAIGVFIAGEHMAPSRWAGFIVIWISLGLLSADMLRRSRQRRRATRANAVSTHDDVPGAAPSTPHDDPNHTASSATRGSDGEDPPGPRSRTGEVNEPA